LLALEDPWEEHVRLEPDNCMGSRIMSTFGGEICGLGVGFVDKFSDHSF